MYVLLARKYRSNSIVNEEEAELGGFQPHIRTIQEDLDPGATRHGVTYLLVCTL